MSRRIRLIVGNWKMNTDLASARALAAAVRERLSGRPNVEVGVCPPACFLAPVADILAGSTITWGGQDVSERSPGAYTGDIAAPMLSSLKCRFAIVGHSERRRIHAEPDALVRAKAEAALAAGLSPIVCVGETLEERDAGSVEAVIGRQVRSAFQGMEAAKASKCVIAYEPVWAIGTGRNATPAQAVEVHRFIRGILRGLFGEPFAAAFRIQYGGSVNAKNAKDLMAEPEIDGALVGGAALDIASFASIVEAAGAVDGA
ncbi:MAG: triose-phosphate isomerase [Planctomycetota bacterium]